jgi:hypothetical protein
LHTRNEADRVRAIAENQSSFLPALIEACSVGTGYETHGYSAMQQAWDIELIFPIKDAASAALMLIKADCLHKAGIISEVEKQWVDCRARMFVDDTTLKDAA